MSYLCALNVLLPRVLHPTADVQDHWLCVSKEGDVGVLPLVDVKGTSTCLHPTASTSTTTDLCLEAGSWTVWAMCKSGQGWAGGSFEVATTDGVTLGSGSLAINSINSTSFEIKQDEMPNGAMFLVRDNTAGLSGGGVFAAPTTKVRLVQTMIENNIARGSGGGVYVDYQADFGLYASVVKENRAGEMGGGMFAYSLSTVALNTSQFVGNIATTSGGGVQLERIESAKMQNVDIVNNTANNGGGLAMSSCDVMRSHLNSVNMTDNVAATGNGGALLVKSSELAVVGGRVERNHAWGNGGGLATAGSEPVELISAPCFAVEVILDWRFTNATCLPCPTSERICDYSVDSCADQRASCDCSGCACSSDDYYYEAERGFSIHKLTSNSTLDITSRAAKDFHGEEMGGVPYTGTIVGWPFCAPAGDYKLLAFDTIAASWFGGTLSVVIDGVVAVDALLVEGEQSEVTLEVTGKDLRNMSFHSNVAYHGGGGAVFWEDAEPHGLWNSTHTDNHALYGNISATPARTLTTSCGDSLNESASCFQVASGKRPASPIYAQILDAYSQRVISENTQIVLAHSTRSSASTTVSDNIAKLVEGQAHLEDLVVSRSPNSTVDLTVVSYITTLTTSSVELTLELRACGTGEIDDGRECVPCEMCENKDLLYSIRMSLIF